MRMLVVLVLLGTLGSAWAQFDFERFALFTDCDSVGLYVSVQDVDDDLAGLSEEMIRNAAESRIRSARLYDDEVSYPALNVFVHIVGGAFHISVYLEKLFLDNLYSQEIGAAETWDSNSTGTHGGDANYVVSAVSGHMDEFLVEYLRVNEEACASQ